MNTPVNKETDGRWSLTGPDGQKQYFNSQEEAQRAAGQAPKQTGATDTSNLNQPKAENK